MAITIQDLERALLEADKAGDTTSANLFAAEIKKIQESRKPQEGGVITGMGKRAAQAGEALYGAGLRLTDIFGITDPQTLADYESRIQESRSVLSPTYRSTEPTGGAEIIGSTATDILSSIFGGGVLKAAGKLPVVGGAAEATGGALLPTTVPQAAAGGALYGLTVPSASTSEMLSRSGLGGVTGGATQFGLRQVGLAPQLPPNLTEQQQQVARRALDEGFQLDPTQITGYGAELKEGIKSNLPFARKAFTRFEEGNQEKTNNIARQLLKLPEGTPLTNDSIRASYTSALNKYKSLERVPSLQGDANFVQRINKQLNVLNKVPSSQRTASDKQAIKVLTQYKDYATNPISGKEAFIRSKAIGDNLFSAQKAEKKSSAAIDAFKELKDAFEQSIENSLAAPGNMMRTTGEKTLNDFRQGRKQLSDWYLINEAFNPNTGNISAATLSRELSKKPTYGRTKTPVETAAMLSGGFPKAFPSSGTSERLSFGNIADVAGLLSSIPAFAATSGPVRNILAQRYLGSQPQGVIGNIYGGVSRAGGIVPESGRVGFGRALMAAEQQQMQQALTPTYGLLGN
jgi:hypothetical protein